MASRPTVPVRILGQEYRVRSEGEPEAVQRAAALLDETMERVRERTGTVDTASVAILAALNLAHQLVALRRGEGGESARDARLRGLAERIESVLAAEPDAR